MFSLAFKGKRHYFPLKINPARDQVAVFHILRTCCLADSSFLLYQDNIRTVSGTMIII